MSAFALSFGLLWWANWSYGTSRDLLGLFCLVWAFVAFIVAIWLLMPRAAEFIVGCVFRVLEVFFG